ncbi:hypothetical protein CR513_54955, partial [Mucuna pruriens]
MTLGCFHESKGALIRMFTSNEWKSSRCGFGKEFWKNIIICLKGACPLNEVLRLVDLDKKPAMGFFIYKEMDQAKEKIQNAFNDVKKSYLPLWTITDEMWNITDIQVDDFRKQAKFFGSPLASKSIDLKTPAEWWESYGDEHPKLQKFTIHILSLTCSSSGCELIGVHTKRRNRLKQNTMNDVVFVMANSKLAKKKKTRKSVELNLDIIHPMMSGLWKMSIGLDLDENLVVVQVGEDEKETTVTTPPPLDD